MKKVFLAVLLIAVLVLSGCLATPADDGIQSSDNSAVSSPSESAFDESVATGSAETIGKAHSV